MPLPSGVGNCGDSENRNKCTWNCVGMDWFSKVNSVNVNATQICMDQGYDGKITKFGLINKRPPYHCAKTSSYPGGDVNDLGYNVAWKCEMKGSY